MSGSADIFIEDIEQMEVSELVFKLYGVETFTTIVSWFLHGGILSVVTTYVLAIAGVAKGL